MLWRERERQTETETETETDRQTEIERQRERVCVSCSFVMFFVLDVCFQVCVWKGEWALMSNFFSLSTDPLTLFIQRHYLPSAPIQLLRQRRGVRIG